MYMEKLARRIAGQPEAGEGPVDQTMQIAVMKHGGNCDFGGMPLDKEDYLVNEAIKGTLKEGDEVLIMQMSEEKHVVLMKVVDP